MGLGRYMVIRWLVVACVVFVLCALLMGNSVLAIDIHVLFFRQTITAEYRMRVS